jgi:serine/threonine protein kinase
MGNNNQPNARQNNREEDYQIIKQLGVGIYATVFLALKISERKHYAIQKYNWR